MNFHFRIKIDYKKWQYNCYFLSKKQLLIENSGFVKTWWTRTSSTKFLSVKSGIFVFAHSGGISGSGSIPTRTRTPRWRGPRLAWWHDFWFWNLTEIDDTWLKMIDDISLKLRIFDCNGWYLTEIECIFNLCMCIF